MCNPKNIRQFFWALGGVLGLALLAAAHHPQPEGDTQHTFSVTAPAGDIGTFCLTTDVVFTVTHTCTNDLPLTFEDKIVPRPKKADDYHDYYKHTITFTTPSGASGSETQYSPSNSYTVVDVEGGVEAPASLTVTGHVVATSLPDGGKVDWQVVGVTNFCTNYPVKITTSYDDNNFYVKVDPETGNGYITVRAKHPNLSTCFEEYKVSISGCQACQAGTCSMGSAQHGACSVSTLFSLGSGARGDFAGQLWISAQTPSLELATPRQLALIAFDPALEEIRIPDQGMNVLRQVLAPEGLADIVPLTEFKYEIRFYPAAAVGPKDSNGLYTVTAAPFVSHTVENPAASTNDFSRLRFTETRGSAQTVYEYAFTSSAGVDELSLSSGNGLKHETLSTQTNALGKVTVLTVRDASGNLASKVRTTWQQFDWGAEIVEQVNDPDGAALTTTRTYYDDTPHPGQYGKLKQVNNPDGSWKRYDYDPEGRTILEVSSWLDALTNATPSAASAVYNNYTPVDPLDDGTVLAHQPRLVEEKILGTTVARTFYACYYSTNNPGERIEIEEQAPTASAAYGAAGNLRTTRFYYPVARGQPESGKIKSATYPDGRLDSFDYEAGDYASGTFAVNPTGTFVRATTVHGITGSPEGIANKTTKYVSVADRFGRTVLEEQYVYTGGSFALIAWTQYTRDEFGRELTRLNSKGELFESAWDCCGKSSDVDATGQARTYSYDALQRLELATKVGIAAGTYPAQETITTAYTLDALGRQVQTVVSAGSLSQVSSNVYDLAGRQTRSVNAAGLVSEYAYAANGLIETATLPGGFTRITERFKDGQTKSITGTAQINEYHEYGVNPDGSRWTKIYSASNNSPVWVKTTTDLLGRPVKEEKPGYLTTETTENFYNNKGQLVRQSTADGLQSLFAYDELGNQIRSGLDVNANGVLDLAGLDRITESEMSYVQINNDWWQQTVNRLYTTDNSATPLTTSITRQRLTGLAANTIAETVSIDWLGNQTVSTTILDRSNKKVTQTVNVPNSTGDDISIAVNGLLVSSQRSTFSAPTLYAYDALGRPTAVTDARTGSSATHYDSHGWVDYTEDATGNRTSFTFDSATGRRLSQFNALTGSTYWVYTAQGLVEKTWGSAGYPERYEYDQYNRKIKMATYRASAGFDGPAWPASAGEGDVTTWTYHEPSGLLTAKTDAAGKQVSYTYDSANRLASRTWSRTVGGIGDPALVTTYSYSPSGDLTGIDYSDNTPDVAFTYDRLGRQKTASSSVSTHTFAYSGLLLDTETIATSSATNIIARAYDFLGRPVAAALSAVSAAPDYQVAYGYDALGRLSQISNFQFQASYSYLPNSDLIETLSTDNGLLITRSYEDHRNLLTQIENSLGTNVVSSYAYANDALNRRTSAVWGGSAFDELGPTVMKYAYNTRSEVIGAERFFGDNPATASEPVAGQNWDYAFDPIGNRQTAARDGDTEIYTANNLNQYTLRTIPSAVHVAGTAAEDSTVTINRPTISGTTVEPVTRQGAYFHKKLALDNSAQADREEIEVIGVKAGAGTNGMDIVSAYTGFVWAAKSPEQFTYDADGNMLSDALRKYEWDAENRLVAVTASNVVDGTLTRVEFAYDYMSRRISKTVYAWNATSNEFQISSFSSFLYDGWLLVREQSASGGNLLRGKIVDEYVWGLDLSGTLQGAGGISGLLARYRTEHRYYDGQDMLIICHRPPGNPENRQTLRINEAAWPAHQAHGDTLGACDGSSISNSAFLYTFDGNGNVSELIQASGVGLPASVLAAHYEYSPFGETIAAVGPEAFDNPFRFSTKRAEDNTGLVLYEYRPYSPSLGRFLSRDPIGEEGGLHLYRFVDNSSVNRIDVLGNEALTWSGVIENTRVSSPFMNNGRLVNGTASYERSITVNFPVEDNKWVIRISGWGGAKIKYIPSAEQHERDHVDTFHQYFTSISSLLAPYDGKKICTFRTKNACSNLLRNMDIVSYDSALIAAFTSDLQKGDATAQAEIDRIKRDREYAQLVININKPTCEQGP